MELTSCSDFEIHQSPFRAEELARSGISLTRASLGGWIICGEYGKPIEIANTLDKALNSIRVLLEGAE